MYICALLLSADSQLGCVDYNSLSDQKIMELLFEGLTDRAKMPYQDADGMFARGEA